MASLAQNLPTLVLETIVRYACLYPHTGCYVFKYQKEMYRRSSWSIIRVCRWWKEAALTVLHSHVLWNDLDKGSRTLQHDEFASKSPRLLHTAAQLGTENNVRAVTVQLRCADVLEGRHLTASHLHFYSSISFSHVTELSITFTGVWFRGNPELYEATEHADTFCSIVHRLFPSIRSVRFMGLGYFSEYSSTPFVTSLIRGLVQGATGILAEHCACDISKCISPEIPFRKLAFGSNSSPSHCAQLISRSSSTLEYVEIGYSLSGELHSILFDHNGDPVVYKRLRHFKLASLSKQKLSSHSEHFGKPQFPLLETLTCISAFPFESDIMFNGNSKTLRMLNIAVDRATLAVLEDILLHNSRHFASIDCLHLSNTNSADDISCNLVADLAFRIGKNATILTYSGGGYTQFSHLMTPVNNMASTLRVLELPSMLCALEDAIMLIQELPFIQRLRFTCQPTDSLRGRDRTHDRCMGGCDYTNESDDGQGDDDEAGEQTADYVDTYTMVLLSHVDPICADLDILDDLYKRYYPLSETLQVLGVDSRRPLDQLSACRMVVILSALCSSIQHLYFYEQLGRYGITQPGLIRFKSFSDLVTSLQVPHSAA